MIIFGEVNNEVILEKYKFAHLHKNIIRNIFYKVKLLITIL